MYCICVHMHVLCLYDINKDICILCSLGLLHLTLTEAVDIDLSRTSILDVTSSMCNPVSVWSHIPLGFHPPTLPPPPLLPSVHHASWGAIQGGQQGPADATIPPTSEGQFPWLPLQGSLLPVKEFKNWLLMHAYQSINSYLLFHQNIVYFQIMPEVPTIIQLYML